MRARRCSGPLIVGLGLILAIATSSAEPGAEAVSLTAEDSQLTGEDIYRRVLDNRFESYVQSASLISGDRAGNTQETRFQMWYQSYRKEDGTPIDGIILSKAVVRYTFPYELRRTGYLVINNLDRVNDQFVYRHTSGYIRRVNLRGESVFGSDFSLEDIVPQELEHATYARLADAVEQDKSAFVIVVTPKPEAASEYSKVQIYVDKERSVPLRSRYWDDRGSEFKELMVPASRVERNNDVWVPMEMSIRNTKLESFSKLEVEKIKPNARISRDTFDLRKLLEN